jgi:hypothetical protein
MTLILCDVVVLENCIEIVRKCTNCQKIEVKIELHAYHQKSTYLLIHHSAVLSKQNTEGKLEKGRTHSLTIRKTECHQCQTKLLRRCSQLLETANSKCYRTKGIDVLVSTIKCDTVDDTTNSSSKMHDSFCSWEARGHSIQC